MISSFTHPSKVVIRKYIVGFMKRLDFCENVIINTLFKWSDVTNWYCVKYGSRVHIAETRLCYKSEKMWH